MLRISAICLSAVVLGTFAAPASAEQTHSTVVFEDEFDREVSGDEAKLGNEWKLNTKEMHQFVLKDGALHVTRNTDAKHSANLLHQAEFRNGTLEMRFKLVNQDDSFRVQFRDSAFTKIKQGMLFNVLIGDGKLELQDAVIAYEIKQQLKSVKAAQPSPEQQQVLDKAKVSAPLQLSAGPRHDLRVDIQGNKLTVSIDGKEAASLSSAAIGHATKDNFRVEVNPALVIDNIKVSKKGT